MASSNLADVVDALGGAGPELSGSFNNVADVLEGKDVAPKWVPDSDGSISGTAKADEPSRSLLQRIKDRPGEMFGEAEAVGSMLLGAAVAPIAAAAGLVKGVTGGKYGTQEGAAEAAQTARDVSQAMTYQPRTQSGQNTLETIGRAVDTSKIAGLGPVFAPEMMALSAAPKPVAAAAPAAEASAGVRGGQLASVGAAGAKPAEQAIAMAAKASPELRANIEKAVEQAGKGKGGLNLPSIERHIEADTLPVPVKLTRGQALQDADIISQEQNMRGVRKEYIKRFEDQNKALVENADAIREQAAPDVFVRGKPEQGQAILDAYKEIDKGRRAEISANYKALNDAAGGQFPLDGGAFVKNADAALSAKMKGRYLPGEIRGDLDDIGKTGRMTFEEFENLRTTLAGEMRKAERAGDGNRSYALGLVRDELEKFPMPAGAAPLKELADKARSSAKARFDALRADPAYNAAVNDTVKPGDVVSRFVIGQAAKDPAKLKTMIQNLGENSVAHQTMAAGLLDELKDQAVGSTGNFSQSKFNNMLAKVRPGLVSVVPQEQAQQLEKLGRVAGYTQIQPRGSYVNTSNSAVAAMAVEGAKSAAEHGINTAIGLPAGTYGRKLFGAWRDKREMQEALQTGAGIYLKDVK